MRHRFFTVIAFTAALTFAALAQETPARPDGGGGTEARPQQLRIEQLEFPGGSVVQYVDRIRRIIPEANFVLMDGAEQFNMPPMTLRNVPLASLVSLINETATLRQGNGEIRAKAIGDVYAVQVVIFSPRRQQPDPAVPLVMSLADIVGDDVRAEDVLTSIETALELFGDEYPQARVRYHDATRLLIARGHPDQMSYVSDVVHQLRAGRPRRDPRQVIGDPVHTAAQVQLQERRLEELQQRIAELEAALAKAREND